MTTKQKYIELCSNIDNLSIFMTPWWLDCVYKRQWDVLLYEPTNEIVAAMPYCIHKKYGFKTIMPAHLTPRCGIYVDYSSVNSIQGKYNLENKAYEYFASEIDKMGLAAFFYTTSTDSPYPLGMVWNGFNVKKRITYRIETNSQDAIYEKVSTNLKRNIQKARKIPLTVMVNNLPLGDLYSLMLEAYSKRRMAVPFSKDFFVSLVETSIKYSHGEVLIAKDKKNRIHGFIFVVWDDEVMYSLISATSKKFRLTNSISLINLYAIEYAKSKGIGLYDFEGSMIPNIERYYRSYGGTRYEYCSIEKYYSKIYKWIRHIKKSK